MCKHVCEGKQMNLISLKSNATEVQESILYNRLSKAKNITAINCIISI